MENRFVLFFILLVLTLAGVSNGGLVYPQFSTSLTLPKLKKSAERNVKIVLKRLPSAIVNGGKKSIHSFVLNSARLIPLGIGVSFVLEKHRTVSHLAKSGFHWGVKLAQHGAFCAGGEAFLATMRNNPQDKWNRILGAGIGSAAINVYKGPTAVVKGFLTGMAISNVVNTLSSATKKKPIVLLETSKSDDSDIDNESSDIFTDNNEKIDMRDKLYPNFGKNNIH